MGRVVTTLFSFGGREYSAVVVVSAKAEGQVFRVALQNDGLSDLLPTGQFSFTKRQVDGVTQLTTETKLPEGLLQSLFQSLHERGFQSIGDG